MRYLLDTNIVSDLFRNPQGRTAAHIAKVGEDGIFTSLIVAAELRYGAARKGSQRLCAQLEAVLSVLDVQPLKSPTDRLYGDLGAHLEKKGQLIGPNDLLIAAQALALECTLVTDDIAEFSRVPKLTLENWLR